MQKSYFLFVQKKRQSSKEETSVMVGTWKWNVISSYSLFIRMSLFMLTGVVYILLKV